MKISNDVLDEINARIKDMLVIYQQELEIAYLAVGDDPLSVAISIKVSPENGKQKIVTGINFVKDRCKDSVTSFVDDIQINLFDEEGGTE